MGRSWLQVMMGEVQSKVDDAERLRERRESVSRSMTEVLEEIVRPALEMAARSGGARYWEEPGGEQLFRRCIVDWGDRGHMEAAFDAFQPLLALSAISANGPPRRSVVRLDRVDRQYLEDWIAATLPG